MEEARLGGLGTLWAGGDQYRLGSSYGPYGATTQYFSGDLDEVAVYSRTLSAAEITDHYLRGALRLSFQVRSCDDATVRHRSLRRPWRSCHHDVLGVEQPGPGPALGHADRRAE